MPELPPIRLPRDYPHLLPFFTETDIVIKRVLLDIGKALVYLFWNSVP